jgi:outer membrane receptor protein involved in Fe transport
MKKTIKEVVKMAAFYASVGFVIQILFWNLIIASTPVAAQNLRDVKVSVNVNNVKLEKALQVIESKTNFIFSYLKDEIPADELVSLNCTEESLYDVLCDLGKNIGLNFSRINEYITIKKNSDNAEPVVTGIETCTVKGYVTDADTKEALQGVTVKINGTTIGTFTDKRGYYEINNLKPGKYSVVASYVGYAAVAKEITISSGKAVEVDFQLGQSVVNLDEVTVTGSLSERSQKAIANPISTLEIKNHDAQNLTLIGDAIATLPGVSTYIAADGTASYGKSSQATLMLNVRGTVTGSSTNPTSVKVIVDGVEESAIALTSLDPNEIEKIELLKGPMGSALYGTGSSTGVLQIFTRKGSGATKIEFKSMFTTRNDKYADGNPMTYQYTLSLSGGKPDFGYKLSGNYSLYPISRYALNNGIDENSYGLNGNVNGNIGNFKIQLGFNTTYRNNGSAVSPTTSYLIALDEGWPNASKLKTITTLSSDCESKTTSLDLNLNIKHVISNNIYHNITLGSSQNSSETIYNAATTTTSGTYYPYPTSGAIRQTIRYFMNWTQPVFTDYSIDITGGVDVRRQESYSTTDYYSTALNLFGISRSTTTITTGSRSQSESITKGFFAEGVWGYKNRLFFTTGLRLESDNSYGGDIGWYPMAKFGLTYVFSLGNFTLKPRVAYGKSTEAVNVTYKLDRTVISGSYTYIYKGNPDIKPEHQDGYEIGADIFFTNNYSLSFTYFNQRVRDKTQSSYTKPDAYTYIYTYLNAASITNNGFEISAKGIIAPFMLELNYSYVDSRYGAGYNTTTTSTSAYIYDGGRVILLPSTSIFARLSYSLPAYLSLCEKRGSLSFEVAYKGHWLSHDYYSYYKYYCENGSYNSDLIKYYKDDPGYVLLNMNISYPVFNELLLYANVKNLLDYQKLGIGCTPLSGRMIAFGFRVSY